ncbi:MAG: deaminase [bacterium]|nr:deaminase [bacterium]
MGGGVVVAYVPVLHKGYWQFFVAHWEEYPELGLIHPNYIDIKSLCKDVRALPPELMVGAIDSLDIFESVRVIYPALFNLGQLSKVMMPDDDVSRYFAEQYLKGVSVEYDSIFLRWDRTRALAQRPVTTDLVADPSNIDQILMLQAIKLGEKSADWWRQVGALVVKDGKIIASIWNKHVPDEQQPYYDGDPRAEFSQGVHLELSTAEHCEAYLVGEAAGKGVALEGTDFYVSTFPCPPCARLLSRTGIKRLLYHDGYAVLDGEIVLREAGIEIVQVVF